jgi:hypothetical protein
MNINKFMAIFEWICCLGKDGRISYEHCKVLTMLLQVLPNTFDSGPSQVRSEVWQAEFERRKGGAKVTGMGLAETMAASGYGWFPQRIDYEQLQFRPEFSSSSAFNNSMLYEVYRKNWKLVKDAKDDLARLEATDSWLQLYKGDPECLAWIQGYLLYFLMQSYRKEVFRYWKDLVRPEFEQEAIRGRIALCYASILKHFRAESLSQLRIVEPSRTKTKTIEELVFFLWDDKPDADLSRGPWEDAPFRTFTKRALQILGDHCGRETQTKFREEIKRYFTTTHWFFPQPTQTKFIQRGKGKVIQCIAIYHTRLVYSRTYKGAILFPSQLRQLCDEEPSSYRPKPKGLTIKELQETLYMPDWRLVNGNKGPIMSQVIDIEEVNTLPFDSGLLAIQEMLEQKWSTWDYLERTGQRPE